MKNNAIFEHMYLRFSKGSPPSKRRHVAWHSLTHCEHFECKQVGVTKCVANVPCSKTIPAVGTQFASSNEVLTSMGRVVHRGGCQASQVSAPHDTHKGTDYCPGMRSYDHQIVIISIPLYAGAVKSSLGSLKGHCMLYL